MFMPDFQGQHDTGNDVGARRRGQQAEIKLRMINSGFWSDSRVSILVTNAFFNFLFST